MRQVAQYALDSMKRGAKAQCAVIRREKYEVNIEACRLTLMRSTTENEIRLTAIDEQRRGVMQLGTWDKDAVRQAAEDTCALAASSQPDDAYDIAALESGRTEFSEGWAEADPDALVRVMDAFLQETAQVHPLINHDTTLCFIKTETFTANTNGVGLLVRDGRFEISSLFSARRGTAVSSFNGLGAYTRTRPASLLAAAGMGDMMASSVRELDAQALGDKFTGDVILAPGCLAELLEAYIGAFLSDRALITGTSVLKDKLGQKVAASMVNLYANPLSGALCGEPVTADGFRAGNMSILENGVLRNFTLSQYAANKTGLKRAANLGLCLEIPAGQTSLDRITAGVKKGLLVGRFSGGSPSENGDFSGVAKNSYFIENGAVTRPVQETMIAGNLLKILENVQGISTERINFGNALLPWVLSGGVTISG